MQKQSEVMEPKAKAEIEQIPDWKSQNHRPSTIINMEQQSSKRVVESTPPPVRNSDRYISRPLETKPIRMSENSPGKQQSFSKSISQDKRQSMPSPDIRQSMPSQDKKQQPEKSYVNPLQAWQKDIQGPTTKFSNKAYKQKTNKDNSESDSD